MCCMIACCVCDTQISYFILQNTETVPRRHSVPVLPSTYNPAFCVYGTDCSGTLYEWTQTFVLLCLAYVTEHNAFGLHPRCRLCPELPSFRLDNIHCVDGREICLSVLLLRPTWIICISSLMSCHICGCASSLSQSHSPLPTL